MTGYKLAAFLLSQSPETLERDFVLEENSDMGDSWDLDIESAYLIDGKIVLRSGRDIGEDYRLVFSRLPYEEVIHNQPRTEAADKRLFGYFRS